MTSSTSVAMTTCPASSAEQRLQARVRANLATLQRRITSCGRALDSVRVVGVTKTFGVDVVRAAAAAGLTCLGENYVGELAAKREATRGLAVRWHYLGALQTNKIARVLALADVICGVSREREIDRIARRPGAAIYVQVDFTGAAGRNGAAPHEVAALVQRGRERGLDVRGLMTVAPTGAPAARAAFRATAELADGLGLLERSMGMSDDLELALEAGSSEIRVGRALFGERNAQGALA
jgi:PLP dependent protein